MGLELTDRIISEIVEAQIDFIKKRPRKRVINYKVLAEDLTAGLKEYSSRNKEPDYKLFNKLEKEDSTQGGVYTRLLKVVRASDLFRKSPDKLLKERHFLEIYKLVEEEGLEAVPLYGLKTHKFLKTYLIEKGLI